MKSPRHILAAILFALALAAGPESLKAQSTVTYSAGPGLRDVLNTSGSALADGNYVSIGAFNQGFNVSAFSQDLAALGANWKEYDSTTIRTIFAQPGRFADSAQSSNPTYDNLQIWIWIFQTPDQSAPDASYSNVTGYGLYTSTAPNWVFPAQGGQPLDMTISIDSNEINQTFWGSLDPTHLMLQPVPEPSLIPILLVGTGLLYGWTRRGFGSR